MRNYLKGLMLLPVFVVSSGFGPFDLDNETEINPNSFTHISVENKVYLSKEDLDKKIAEYRGAETSLAPVRKRAYVKPGIFFVSATAYSSTVDQCDADPFTTASGQRVRDGIIAANFLPFGTKVKIPDYYGDKIFVVQDRMNARYTSRVDVWMNTRAEAYQFGVKKNLRIEVL